jgi:metal transporter CNNM
MCLAFGPCIRRQAPFSCCVVRLVLLCARADSLSLKMTAEATFMPEIVQYCVCLALVLTSGMFAGLTLGLMSLDLTGLKIIMAAGEEPHRTYAAKIYPLREKGNLLLCTLLLGNVVINNTLAILTEQLWGGLIAIIAASAATVLFAEIIPQAVFGRHRLWTGAHTRYLTWFFYFVMLPITWPIAKILDLVLGEELGVEYSRDELRQLLQQQQIKTSLDHQEVNVLRGALEVCLLPCFPFFTFSLQRADCCSLLL